MNHSSDKNEWEMKAAAASFRILPGTRQISLNYTGIDYATNLAPIDFLLLTLPTHSCHFWVGGTSILLW